MARMEKIAILNYSTAEVLIASISSLETTKTFLARKGLDSNDVGWMRGNFKILIEDGINKD